MASKASLYRVAEPSKKSKKTEYDPLSASKFTTSLKDLLDAPSTSKTSRPAPRPSKIHKDDIFRTHNRGTNKRALADISDGVTSQRHSTTSQDVDANTLHRAKRKMEEKARLYASMKRGDYVPRAGGHDKEAEGLVDFDRKWADKEEQEAETSSDDYASSDDGGEETIEYEDEFGRVRKGTKAEVKKLERQRKAAAYAEQELEEFSARPSRPDNLIQGDTVQSAAFNPDEPIAAKMAEMAQKRDRSLTPPPDMHYDASKEIRSKGVGFYQFSGDKEEREKQMADLDKERKETERAKGEREEKRKKRERDIEERRKKIVAQRNKGEADAFLNKLDMEIGAGGNNEG